MKPQIVRAGSLLAAMAIGCTPMTVRHDYDPDVDFSVYKTFDWMSGLDNDKEAKSMLSGPFLEKRIRKAVLENMAAKGFQKTTQDPDFLIAHHVSFKRKSDVDAYGPGYGYHGYWGHHAAEIRRYTEGTLILDFVDPATQQLVWRGWSISAVTPDSSPHEEQVNINKATAVILKRFPPYGD